MMATGFFTTLPVLFPFSASYSNVCSESRAELKPNVNAQDGEVISDWPLTGVFEASLQWLPAQLFGDLEVLESGRYFATYSLTALGGVPCFWKCDDPLPVAWTRSRHSLVVQLLHEGALCMGDASHRQLLAGWKVCFSLPWFTLGSAVMFRNSQVMPETTPLAAEETQVQAELYPATK